MVFITSFVKDAISKISIKQNGLAAVRVLQAKFGPVTLLYAWGGSAVGEVGLEDRGRVLSSASPIQVGNDSWVAISATRYNVAAAIRSDGLLFTWGGAYSNVGQLGDGTTTNRSSPVQIGSSSWTAVSAGRVHVAAIRSDGALFTWGSNFGGQLGLGDSGNTTNRSSPVQVGSSSWSMVSAGDGFTAGITLDGRLFTWGKNNSGVLGLGDADTGTNRSSPVQVGTSSWTMVSAGDYHTAAIRSDGALFTWGDNGRGYLGDETIESRSSPVQIGASSWTFVSAGLRGFQRGHTAAIRSDGALFTWGYNENGVLGDGTEINRSSPVQIGSSSWTTVSVGVQHTAAIRSDGALFTWGYNFNGELGNGTRIKTSSPVQVGSSSWLSVATAYGISNFSNGHTIAVRGDGALFSWGSNFYGQFGINDSIANRSFPVQVGSSSWAMVSTGPYHTAAIRSDNLLFTWGYNNAGQLGDGTVGSDNNKSSPTQIGTSSWTMVSTGQYHTAAIRSDGRLFAWGLNGGFAGFGQLGDGTRDNRSSPVQVGTSSWTTVSAGGTHTGAITSNGRLFMWGAASLGRLGTGNNTNRSSPVQVGSSSWTTVSAGGTHTGAITSNGALFTWGGNNAGRLGHGNTTNRSSPVQVGSSSWAMTSAGVGHTAAILTDGLLFTWGFGGNGQLGLGDTAPRSSPVQVGNSSWSMVSAGAAHTAAIRSDNLLFAWGGNTSYGRHGARAGFLGDNTSDSKSSPVQVGSMQWTSVSAGFGHTMGISAEIELLPI